MKSYVGLVLLLLVVVVWPARADVRMIPRISVAEQYTDNLYLDKSREEDWITTVAPGLTLTYRDNWVDSSLDYGLDFLFYANNTEENQKSISDAQRILGSATLFPTSPFTLKLEDEYSRVAVNTREAEVEENNVFNKGTRNRFEAIPELTLNFGPTWTTVFGGSYQRIDFQDDAGDNTERYRLRAGVVKRLSSRLSLLGDAIATWLSSEDNDDFFRHEYLFGFDYQISRTLRLVAKAGPSWTEFDTRGTETGISKELSLSYGADPLSALLSYSSTIESSAEEGAYTQDRFRAEVGYAARLGVVAGVTWTRNDFEESDNLDKSFGGDLTVRWNLTSKASWSNGVTATRLTFDPEGERIYRLGLSSELSYLLLRTLTLSLRYTHQRDDSSVDANDYFNNIMLARLTWQR